MNLTEYNAMPEGDLKLAVRLAVTMGWTRISTKSWHFPSVLVYDTFAPIDFGWRAFDPFTDASIPYGLIGRGVDEIGFLPELDDFWVSKWSGRTFFDTSKTHAILNAYCAADPSGHWARFLKGE